MHTTPTRTRRGSRRLATYYLAAAALVAGLLVAVIPPAQAADQSISVNFSTTNGSPTYRASGWIYGMTENAAAPPDQFFKDVKFRYMRAGGAQLDSPGGWVSGRYDRRWNATRAQLLRTRSLGGEFVLLVHDLWGADGYAISRFPGDNGDWTDYDNFLTRLIADVKATGAPVQWDLWNEPNITLFWNRPQSQYFELWRRTFQRVRSAFPAHLIVGPSCACVPSTTNAFWTAYLDYVRANSVVPDIVSWHALPSDPVANVAAANTTLDARGIPHTRPYQINEYGASSEQHPAGGAWYIARLERAGADGLRANWAGGSNLHNDLASLLTRNSAGQYLPKGEWWAYQFYGTQTGQIASVTASAAYDAFATKTAGSARILVGGAGTTGNIAVNLQRLDATSGIVQNNRVRVVAQRIPYNGGAAVTGPVTVQDSVVTVSNNATTVNLAHSTAQDAFTITLLPPDGSGSSSASPPSSPASNPPSSPPSSPAGPGSGWRVAYDVSAWATGLTANVVITNTGASAVNGWSLVFTLPTGQTIVSGWNATYTPASGQVTAKNASYNASIPANGSTTIGFQATHTGNSAEPTSFTLNGASCAIS